MFKAFLHYSGGLFAAVLVIGLSLPAYAFQMSDAEIASSEKLLGDFYNNLQTRAVKYYENETQLFQISKNCLESEECQDISGMQIAFREFRRYAAALDYKNFRKQMARQGHVYLAGPGNAYRLYFDRNTKEGRKEFKILRKESMDLKIAMDLKFGKKQVLYDSSSKSRDQRLIRLQALRGRSAFYKARIQEYLDSYPVFAFIQNGSPQRADFIDAMDKMINHRVEMIQNIAGLEGDEKQELLGFAHIVSEVINDYNEEQSHQIANYIKYLQSQQTVLSRIIDIVTSPYLFGVLTCHFVTKGLNAPHPIVLAVKFLGMAGCSLIGITMTSIAMIDLTEDVFRQMYYMKTTKYSEEVYAQYANVYLASLVMAVIYVVPSLPSLKKNIGMGIKHSSKVFKELRKSLQKPGKLFDLGKEFRDQMKGLGRSYVEYYGQEAAVKESLAAGGRLMASVAVVEGALAKSMNRALQERLVFFKYSDFIKALP